MTSTESFRRCLEARRVPQYGGGACTVLVRHIHGRIELLFHADLETAAVLTNEQAHVLGAALIEMSTGEVP